MVVRDHKDKKKYFKMARAKRAIKTVLGYFTVTCVVFLVEN